MPCRVGITTNPAGRKSYWEGQVVGLKNWQILAKYATKAEAQVYETTYADLRRIARLPRLTLRAGCDWSLVRLPLRIYKNSILARYTVSKIHFDLFEVFRCQNCRS
jgi:hypothetical protein